MTMCGCRFQGYHGSQAWDTAFAVQAVLTSISFLVQGYSGSQLWDTAFAVQALAATQLGDQLGDSLAKAGSFIEATQVHEQQLRIAHRSRLLSQVCTCLVSLACADPHMLIDAQVRTMCRGRSARGTATSATVLQIEACTPVPAYTHRHVFA